MVYLAGLIGLMGALCWYGVKLVWWFCVGLYLASKWLLWKPCEWTFLGALWLYRRYRREVSPKLDSETEAAVQEPSDDPGYEATIRFKIEDDRTGNLSK